MSEEGCMGVGEDELGRDVERVLQSMRIGSPRQYMATSYVGPSGGMLYRLETDGEKDARIEKRADSVRRYLREGNESVDEILRDVEWWWFMKYGLVVVA